MKLQTLTLNVSCQLSIVNYNKACGSQIFPIVRITLADHLRIGNLNPFRHNQGDGCKGHCHPVIFIGRDHRMCLWFATFAVPF